MGKNGNNDYAAVVRSRTQIIVPVPQETPGSEDPSSPPGGTCDCSKVIVVGGFENLKDEEAASYSVLHKVLDQCEGLDNKEDRITFISNPKNDIVRKPLTPSKKPVSSEELKGLIEQVKKDNPNCNFTVLGHSQGAIISANAVKGAECNDGHFCGAVTYDPAPSLHPSMHLFDPVIAAMNPSWVDMIAGSKAIKNIKNPDPCETREFRKDKNGNPLGVKSKSTNQPTHSLTYIEEEGSLDAEMGKTLCQNIKDRIKNCNC